MRDDKIVLNNYLPIQFCTYLTKTQICNGRDSLKISNANVKQYIYINFNYSVRYKDLYLTSRSCLVFPYY